MIKWGRRKKQQPPSSPRPSLLSSWLVRLKKMGGGTANAGGHYNDVVVAGKHHNPTPPPPCRSKSRNHHNSPSTEELYGGDEAFWRLSFRKEKVYGGYETEEEDENREAFTEMVSGIRRMKELQKITTSERLREREFKTRTPRRKILIKSSSPSSTSSRRRRRRIRNKGMISHVKEEEEEDDSGDDRRKCVYVNRGGSPIPKRRGKKQGISCRVVGRAAEVVNRGGLERFAVVKCSFDPERDFRESMVEMILERNICGAQQLEDLLACYLALNSHHYHHLIINVFRQIWFHFNN